MAEVVLLGSFHEDTQTRRRWRSLVWERPDILTQELSSDRDFENLARNMDKIVTEGWLPPHIEQHVHCHGQQIYRRLKAGQFYELLIPRKYARKRDVPLHYVDHPMMEEKRSGNDPFLEKIRKDLQDALNQKTFEEIRMEIENVYEQTIFAWLSDIETQTRIVDQLPSIIFEQDRDEFAARRIVNLAIGTENKVVHLCGLLHTLDDAKGRTLYSKLAKVDGIDLVRRTLRHYD